MDKIFYFLARLGVALLQAMPLRWLARLGRGGGELAFWLDARHRKVALQNLTLCFQAEKSPKEIRALAHENFRRIGENFACSVKTASMPEAQLKKIMAVTGAESAAAAGGAHEPKCLIYASGHFGNFELFARLTSFIEGYKIAATYRGMRPAWLNRMVLSLRQTTGNIMYERRTDADALKKAMGEGGRLLVLFADQSTRENGMELPLFGRPCWTSRAPAVMAMRYKGVLFVPICYRTSLGRWRIEVGKPIATHEGGARRSIEALTRDMNSAMEAAIRRDPANWFWVHNRWKLRAEANSTETLEPTEDHKGLAGAVPKSQR